MGPHTQRAMSFWDNLKDKVGTMSNSLQTNISRFKNADFANGTMAMCAMIAAADGSVSGQEKGKIATLITQNEMLKIFPASELKQKFDHFCDKISADYDFGKVEAIQAISKLKSKPDQARAVIQIGIIIGGSDGNFDADEKKAVKEACNAAGISPSDFDL
jgi:tellurite resistance protein TerB